MTTEVRRSSIFTFPFSLLIDRRDPPTLSMMRIGGTNVRVYPPFRSAAANWTTMPAVPAYAVPFLEGRRPNHIKDDASVLMSMATLPGIKAAGLQEDVAMQVIFAPNWEKDKIPVIFPMDSLRLDIIPLATSAAGEANPAAICQKLMSNLRCLSRQWWVARGQDAIQGWMRNEFPVDEYGKPEGDIYATGQGQAPIGLEIPITRRLWEAALVEVAQRREPAVELQLLMDAEYFKAADDPRRMTLDAATACEIAKDQAFERLWTRTNTEPFRRGKAMTGWDVPKHLSTDLEALCGRSLKSEEPHVFADIEELWDARGNVAHGEAAFFRRDGSRIAMEGDVAIKALRSAHACVAWLHRL